jgi:hypothetical protein
MKVTVFRPKLANGLGPPKAFLGDAHPTQGDWVQSSKSDQPDGMDPHRLLHMMARDFLIRSMYHVTEPRFIGYAIENYGAACEILGYSLPLTEEFATWPHYEQSEVDPATDDDLSGMLTSISKVFGAEAASKQSQTLGAKWSPRVETGSKRGRKR